MKNARVMIARELVAVAKELIARPPLKSNKDFYGSTFEDYNEDGVGFYADYKSALKKAVGDIGGVRWRFMAPTVKDDTVEVNAKSRLPSGDEIEVLVTFQWWRGQVQVDLHFWHNTGNPRKDWDDIVTEQMSLSTRVSKALKWIEDKGQKFFDDAEESG